jgi:hypothetical protein
MGIFIPRLLRSQLKAKKPRHYAHSFESWLGCVCVGSPIMDLSSQQLKSREDGLKHVVWGGEFFPGASMLERLEVGAV